MDLIHFPKINYLIDLLNAEHEDLQLKRDLLPLMVEIAGSSELPAYIRGVVQCELGAGQAAAMRSYRLIEKSLILAETKYHILRFASPDVPSIDENRVIYYPSDRRIYLNCSRFDISFDTFLPPETCKLNVFHSGEMLKRREKVFIKKIIAKCLTMIQ